MVKNKINWKPIKVDDATLNSEGFIALEECTDYDLTTQEKPTKKVFFTYWKL